VTGPPDLNELTAELRELSRAFGVADASLREPAEGSDATGAVTVVLDAAGRVSDVRPAARRRDRLPSDQVGDAVVEAAQAAAVNRLDAWSQALDAQGPDAQPIAGGGSGAPEPAPAVDLAALRADAPYLDLIGMLGEVTDTLDQVVVASKAPVVPAAATQNAPVVDFDADDLSYGSRPVVVGLDAAGAVHHVEIELRRLGGADRARLGAALTAAFARAYDLHDARLADARLAAAVGDTAPLAISPQLAEIIRNPAAALAAFAHQL